MFIFIKKYYLLFIAFVFLCSCQSNKKKVAEESLSSQDFTIGIMNLQQKVGQLIARFKRLQFGYTFPFQIR
jgi:hypothetical protein